MPILFEFRLPEKTQLDPSIVCYQVILLQHDQAWQQLGRRASWYPVKVRSLVCSKHSHDVRLQVHPLRSQNDKNLSFGERWRWVTVKASQ
jgi:hypothetical protein